MTICNFVLGALVHYFSWFYIFEVIKTFFIYIDVLNDLYLLHLLCVLNVFKGAVKRYNFLFYALLTNIVSCEHKSIMSEVKSKHLFKIFWSHISIRQSWRELYLENINRNLNLIKFKWKFKLCERLTCATDAEFGHLTENVSCDCTFSD